MLSDNMTLRNMLDYRPPVEDLAMLPLDINVYCKISIISFSKEDNYNFIRYLFADEDVLFYFKDLNKTKIYDFDGSETFQEKIVTIFELFAIYGYENTSNYLKEILEGYNHKADVVIDFYDQNNKAYRLSNLEEIVKLEEMKI